MPSWKKVIVSGSAASLSTLTTSGNISGSSTSTGSFGRLEIAGKSSTNSTISVQKGVLNGILRLQGADRQANPGSYIQLYGPNGSYGSAVFNYGYNTTNSELSFHVNGSEKIRFGGQGEIEAKSLTATGNISGSSVLFTTDGAWNRDDVYPFSFINLDAQTDQSYGMIVRGGANAAGGKIFTGMGYDAKEHFNVFGDGSVHIRQTLTIGGGIRTAPIGNERMHIHRASANGSFMRFTNTNSGHDDADNSGIIIGQDDSEQAQFMNQEDADMFFGVNKIERLRITTDNKISGSATSTGSFGHIVTAGHIVPTAAESFDLGTADKPFRDLHVSSGSIKMYAGDEEIARIQVSDDDEFEFFSTKGLTKEQKKTFTKKQIRTNATPGKFRGGNIGSTTSDATFGSVTVEGDLIAKNYIVSSSTTYMTTSFSSGNTAFGDTQDDTHQFTGSLSVTGSAKITAIDNATLHVASSATNNDTYVRITEGSNYFGGFIKYAGVSNIFELGVHNANDSNVNNDTTAIQILRENNVGDVIFPIANQKISGSATSTGSFGSGIIGRANTNASYGSIKFGVDAHESNERIVLRGDAVEVGPTNYFTGNTYTKGSVGGFTADPSLYVQKGIWVGTGNNRCLAIGGNNADGKTFISAQGSDVDPGNFYIHHGRVGRNIVFQVASGSHSNRTTVMSITTGSRYQPMVELSGDISGSLTSTGSFGHTLSPTAVFSDRIAIGQTSLDSTYELDVTGNINASSYSVFGGIVVGNANRIYTTNEARPYLQLNGTTIQITGGSNASTNNIVNLLRRPDTHFSVVSGSTNLMVVSGSNGLEVPFGNISGSSSSTGSFGNAYVNKILQVAAASNATQEGRIEIGGYDTPMIEFKTHGGWGRQRIQGHYGGGLKLWNSGSVAKELSLQLGHDQERQGNARFMHSEYDTIQIGLNGSYPIAYFGAESGSNNYHGSAVISSRASTSVVNHLHFTNTNILSGSATSTGSFGRVLTNSMLVDSGSLLVSGSTPNVYEDGLVKIKQGGQGPGLFIDGGRDANLRLRSTSYRGGIFIDEPGTSTTMGSALVLPGDNTFRLGTNAHYHMIMYSDTGLTSILSDGVDAIKLDTDQNAEFAGNITPAVDNSSNLGAADRRWANIHSADLQLSNEGTEGNDVDGTTGNWTLQEGEEDIYLINNKTGKKYSIMLKEVKQ